jgi:uncharacterized protein (TIGR02996 family)
MEHDLVQARLDNETIKATHSKLYLKNGNGELSVSPLSGPLTVSEPASEIFPFAAFDQASGDSRTEYTVYVPQRAMNMKAIIPLTSEELAAISERPKSKRGVCDLVKMMDMYGLPPYLISSKPAPMTKRECIIRGIIDNPADDTRRLVFADWLEDFAERDHDRLWAQLIRIQCSPDYSDVNLRVRAILHDGGLDLWSLLNSVHHQMWPLFRDLTMEVPGDHRGILRRPTMTLHACKPKFRVSYAEGQDDVWFHFTRGFLGKVECSAREWERNHDRLVAKLPIEEVKLTTQVPVTVIPNWHREVDGARHHWLSLDWAGKRKEKVVAVGGKNGLPLIGFELPFINEFLRERWPRLKFTAA